MHDITIVPDSVLGRIYGERRQVNSLHHQTVADVAPGLNVTATADDGTIEGLELGENLVAVQWHPR